MEEKQVNGRLRACCQYCGSLRIYKVKSHHIYRCYSCHQTFAVPSTRIVEPNKGYSLKLIKVGL
jgi:ribosomal protein L37AE/L43A